MKTEIIQYADPLVSIPTLREENETVRALRAALMRLGPDGENWHQGGFCNDTADKFCAFGAVNLVLERPIKTGYCSVAFPGDLGPAINALAAAAKLVGACGIGRANDDAEEFSEIRAMFELAIELAA